MTTRRPVAANRIGTGGAIGAVVAVLVVVNLTRSTVVPDGIHLWFNLAAATLVVVIGLAAGMNDDELGIRRDRTGSGLRWGLGAAAVVLVVMVAVALAATVVPAVADAFDDDRAAVGFGEIVLRALVVIPIGTVLVEELVFRGVLHGLLRRVMSARRAMVIGSGLFAAWHLFPASRSSSDNPVADMAGLPVLLGGTFLATFAAGVVFVWLRDRSDSLVAPVIAHIGTNSIPLVVAWSVSGGGS